MKLQLPVLASIGFMTLGLLAAPMAQAKVDFASTLITCQQHDGEEWIEVGIVEIASELFAMTVRNNAAKQTATVIDTRKVHEVAGGRGRAYVDDKTFGLVIHTGEKSLSGTLMVTDGLKKPINQRNMDCMEESDLRYDVE
jgi:hypothetical protein